MLLPLGNPRDEQIAFADRILLNKTELVSAPELDALEQRIRSMNRMATIRRCQNADVPVAEVVGVHAFDLDAKL